MDFLALSEHCAPMVHPRTMAAIVRVESGFNPYAIGVVAGRLVRQPTDRAEAVATAKSLEQQGYNFSVGVGQVNRYTLARYGLDYESAFDACLNLGAGASILSECFARATKVLKSEQGALRAALSCYYSGNFTTGFREGYVARVVGENDRRPLPLAISLASPPSSPRATTAGGRTGHRTSVQAQPAASTLGEPAPSEARSALLF